MIELVLHIGIYAGLVTVLYLAVAWAVVKYCHTDFDDQLMELLTFMAEERRKNPRD